MLQKGGEQGAELPQLLQADQRPGEGQGGVGWGALGCECWQPVNCGRISGMTGALSARQHLPGECL